MFIFFRLPFLLSLILFIWSLNIYFKISSVECFLLENLIERNLLSTFLFYRKATLLESAFLDDTLCLDKLTKSIHHAILPETKVNVKVSLPLQIYVSSKSMQLIVLPLAFPNFYAFVGPDSMSQANSMKSIMYIVLSKRNNNCFFRFKIHYLFSQRYN
jgi:hypothetical protein